MMPLLLSKWTRRADAQGVIILLVQDRFTEFMPWLNKWAGTFVGLTLIAIGLIGLYEAFFEKHEEGSPAGHAEEEEQAMKLALAGGWYVSHCRAVTMARPACLMLITLSMWKVAWVVKATNISFGSDCMFGHEHGEADRWAATKGTTTERATSVLEFEYLASGTTSNDSIDASCCSMVDALGMHLKQASRSTAEACLTAKGHAMLACHHTGAVPLAAVSLICTTACSASLCLTPFCAAGEGSVSVSDGRAASIKRGFATYATGIVYGLQPDALFVVIPALALPTKLAAFAYCTAFVIGTVTAMGGYTLLIGGCSQHIMVCIYKQQVCTRPDMPDALPSVLLCPALASQ